MISKEKEQWNLFRVFLLLKMNVFGGKKEILSAWNPTKRKLLIDVIDDWGRGHSTSINGDITQEALAMKT